MINFNYELDFRLSNEQVMSNWISSVISSESFAEGDINYIFCSDDYLHQLNIKFLNHDTLTDIISFDYKVGKELHGDVFISIDRVKDNAEKFDVHFQNELSRVMIHGILHFCGYDDKTDEDKRNMRQKENYYLKLLREKS